MELTKQENFKSIGLLALTILTFLQLHLFTLIFFIKLIITSPIWDLTYNRKHETKSTKRLASNPLICFTWFTFIFALTSLIYVNLFTISLPFSSDKSLNQLFPSSLYIIFITILTNSSNSCLKGFHACFHFKPNLGFKKGVGK